MHVVVAPDSFKGTLTAAEAAERIAAGWLAVRPRDTVALHPMADGGEGTLDAFAAVTGSERVPVAVVDAVGRPRGSSWLRLPDGTGVVELAAACGIVGLDPLDARGAHTTGFGMAIRAALEAGVSRLLLAIGGSASTDCGAGLLVALGARLLDDGGREVTSPGNSALPRVATVDLSGMPPPPPGGAVVLSDVTNPLLGPLGAAAVFGPQKGGVGIVDELELNVGRFAELLAGDVEAAGAGAAGGAGFALQRWGATTESGARAVAEAVGLEAALDGADLVITGEGRFDSQSAGGKVVSVVREMAGDRRVAVVAGRIDAAVDGLAGAVSLWDLAGEGALTESASVAEEAGRVLASRFVLS
ncbi:glycerate kinase [Tessaracoccus sp. MC1679]|uniref:glycerate kinase n=1 Tax=Tessaracoccus sp. MC1679 TaxID=2760313 RepID=UPI001601FC0F|nr:glycerate kinase [Tessaracoccus sp. MC1679]MBB1517549.1 glycerate kinase [Tessaracoccus sp. MC1679]